MLQPPMVPKFITNSLTLLCLSVLIILFFPFLVRVSKVLVIILASDDDMYMIRIEGACLQDGEAGHVQH